MRRAAVIGAGVVGLYTALALAASGYQVRVYEAEAPGSGASTRNANVLHAVQPPPGRARRRLAREGAALHRVCAPRIGYSIMEVPLVIPALTAVEEVMLPLVALAIKALAPGTRVALASRREALSLEPLLAGSTRRAVIVKGYGVVDSRKIVEALVDAAERAGVEIAGGRVTRVVEGGVELADGYVDQGYEVIVNAAGAGAADVAAASGALRYRVALVEGFMRLYRGPTLNAIVAPVPRPGPGKGGALIPQLDGSLLVGPTWGAPDDGSWKRYSKLVSEPLGGLIREVVGLRTVGEKRDFVIAAQWLGTARVVHLLGIESPGLTAAPALALEALKAAGLSVKSPCNVKT